MKSENREDELSQSVREVELFSKVFEHDDLKILKFLLFFQTI